MTTIRRFLLVSVLTVAGLIAVPAGARAGGRWTPAPPAETFDRPAGVLCDVPIHSAPIVDEVEQLTRPDGVVLYRGRLVIRVTNTDTGAFHDADASGDAYVRTGADGSQTWYLAGPALFGFRENRGTLPRGYWLLDGLYRIVFSTDGYKTVTIHRGGAHDVCTEID